MNLDGLASASVNLGFFDRLRTTLANPDLRPAWTAARKPLRADLRAHAKDRQGPGGAWPARAASTRVRSASGRRTRKVLGRLPGMVRTKLERSRMIFRWGTEWSDIHNSGGRAGHGARIPQREFAWLSDKALELTGAIIARGLAYLIEVG